MLLSSLLELSDVDVELLAVADELDPPVEAPQVLLLVAASDVVGPPGASGLSGGVLLPDPVLLQKPDDVPFFGP